MSLPVCLGVDIGGSKIAAALVDGDGRLLRRTQAPTPAREGVRQILRATIDCAQSLLDRAEVAAIGIGAAGVIKDGRVSAATDLLPGWAGVQLIDELTRGLKLDPRIPVRAINDVHAHGLGEAWVGAGAGSDSILLAAVGTGLGGCLVRDGQVVTGAHGAAGHIGHVPSVDAGDAQCSCGARGHLEAIASGYGLVRLYHDLGGDQSATDARAVVRAAADDDLARQAVHRSAMALGRGLGGMINIVDPSTVIISGGLSAAGRLWWQTVRGGFAESALPLLRDVEVLPAALGDNAGVIGAARLGHAVLDSRA